MSNWMSSLKTKLFFYKVWLLEFKGPRTITSGEKLAPGELPSGQLPLRIIAREENCPPENCSLTVKFPRKIIAPAQTNFPQKVLRVNLGRLCIVCNYSCLWLKNHSTKKYFSRRQIRIKKWFTSIYLLKILNKSARSSHIREHLSLNASWFSYARTQKKFFFWNIYSEKNTKNFIVNNSNKIIHIWYLSSKWLSCRSIINQATGGTSRTKLSPLLQTNIFKYCTLFYNKVDKMYLQ